MNRPYFKLSDIVGLINHGYGYEDELEDITLCLECEEWTWIHLNVSSGLLDDIGDYVVESLSWNKDEFRIWIKTKSFNVPMRWNELEVKDGVPI